MEKSIKTTSNKRNIWKRIHLTEIFEIALLLYVSFYLALCLIYVFQVITQ
jgi:hypothetical protein